MVLEPSKTGCHSRKTSKDRLILSGLVLAALPLMVFSVPWTHTATEALLDVRPWAHMTLELSLNVLWLLLGLGALIQWVRGGSRHHGRLPGLVSLVFVLSLLFPVISASDDQAQLAYINDASTSQSIAASLKNDKQLPDSIGLLSAPVALASQLAPPVSSASEFVSDPLPPVSVGTPGDTTGNHSPPLF